MFPFFMRNAMAVLARRASLEEEAVREKEFADVGFDLTSWKPKKLKAYKQPRTSPPERITVHVTDVNGGFGVSKRRVDAHRKSPSAPPEVLKQLRGTTDDVLARRLALWERYKDLAYHVIAAGNGDVILNRPLHEMTWHGNGSNRTAAGWAIDVGHKQVLDDFMIETGRASLRSLISRMFDELRVAEMIPHTHTIHIAPHRAFSASRRNDTNIEVWTKVVKHVVAETENVFIDYEIKMGKGRPVPSSWDPAALFDARGRRL